MSDTYYEAPRPWVKQRHERWPGIFLAGGITDCPDWQVEMRKLLADWPCIILNPRREEWPMGDPVAGREQILWEHTHLNRADQILFWFPKETLCPIALYELGAWTKTDKPIAIGIEPGYERRVDIEVQSQLQRPDVPIVYTLEDLAREAM